MQWIYSQVFNWKLCQDSRSKMMSSASSISAQITLSTPVRNLPTTRETSLNINNKNLNSSWSANSRSSQASSSGSNSHNLQQRSTASTAAAGGPTMTVRSHQKIRVTVLCARSLAKRDLFRLPDPFVRVHVDGSGNFSSFYLWRL